MTKLIWDGVGQRLYQTGVDHGVLYLRNSEGEYDEAHVWNGLTTVTESPGGAEATPQYADNIQYLNLVSAETFGGTIEAFYSPEAFDQCDGTASPVAGLKIGQQNRRTFGFAYRSLIGNDIDGTDHGYDLHLVYGALAAPSEKARATINDSPEATALSWEFSTTPVDVPGLKPAAHVVISSVTTPPAVLEAIEDILYGTAGTDGRLPLPEELIAIMTAGAPTSVTALTVPTYNTSTHVLTIPTVAGVDYYVDGVKKADGATVTLTTGQTVLAEARTRAGYSFGPAVKDTDWAYSY